MAETDRPRVGVGIGIPPRDRSRSVVRPTEDTGPSPVGSGVLVKSRLRRQGSSRARFARPFRSGQIAPLETNPVSMNFVAVPARSGGSRDADGRAYTSSVDGEVGSQGLIALRLRNPDRTYRSDDSVVIESKHRAHPGSEGWKGDCRGKDSRVTTPWRMLQWS